MTRDVVPDPRFVYRSEARENGLMVILIEEDLARLNGADGGTP